MRAAVAGNEWMALMLIQKGIDREYMIVYTTEPSVHSIIY